jgi:hypothetical protein
MTRARVAALVDAQCGSLVISAKNFAACELHLAQVTTQRDNEAGRVMELRGVDADRLRVVRQNERLRIQVEERWPTWQVVLIGAAAIIVGGAVGYGAAKL